MSVFPRIKAASIVLKLGRILVVAERIFRLSPWDTSPLVKRTDLRFSRLRRPLVAPDRPCLVRGSPDADFPRKRSDARVRYVLLFVNRRVSLPEDQHQADSDRRAEFGAEFGVRGGDMPGQAFGDRVSLDVDQLYLFRDERACTPISAIASNAEWMWRQAAWRLK